MPSYFNIRITIILLVFSIGLIVFHRFGGFQITLPLVSSNQTIDFGPLFSENVNSEVQSKNNVPLIVCQLTNTSGYNYCGISIALSDKPSIGEDLSTYNTIELDIKIDAPLEGARVRFTLRNFNYNYSDINDPVSLKFNTIKYDPNAYKNSIKVPLEAFQVESWWLEQYAIGFDNAQLDYSNIAYIEVITDDMNITGEYRVTLLKATLLGELISEPNLLKTILFFWLFCVTLIITLQRNKLKRVSTTDSLTGLMNRRGLDAWVNHNLHNFSIGTPLTMFYFDIDDFKKVNDSYGHVLGDELLCKLCERVTSVLAASAHTTNKHVFSRLAGDEFSIVFKNLNHSQILDLAQNIVISLVNPIALSSNDVQVSISLGIATSDSEVKSFESLMSRADSAMYHAKKKGKNQFKVFDETVAKDILFRKKVAEKVRIALMQDEFSLKFMPIYYANNLAIYGSEVLLRANSSSLNNIGPEVFIPIAEEFDIIKDIDLWVIENTFKTIDSNRKVINQHSLVFAINISSVELHNSHFPKDVKKLMSKYDIPPSSIEMEITETCLVEADELSISVLNDLRSLGIKLSLDDFGTGFTAFSQLMHYPVNCLKIDKSFVDDLTSKTESRKTMIKAILSIAKAYKLVTVAEGIESINQYQYVTHGGCDMVQGYLFSKPLTLENLLELLNEPKEKRSAVIDEKIKEEFKGFKFLRKE